MDIKIEHHEDKSTIILEKHLNVGSDASKVQNAVLDLIQNGKTAISADLSKLNYITSWEIGILIYAHTTCSNNNVKFTLTKVNDRILSALKKVKLDNIFTII